MANKIIVIEGTDASGKNTQSTLLAKKLNEAGKDTFNLSFPMYDSPTGQVVGGAYLGKPEISQSVFTEGAVNVDGKVSGLYFSADRLYNKPKILSTLQKGNVILDRYVESNMAHQAGKYESKKQRRATYKWFSKLEYGLLGLPKPDIRVLLFMPRQYANQLLKDRNRLKDEHEKDENYLIIAEKAYLEVAKFMKYKIINCVKDGKIRAIEDINQELYAYVAKKLK